MKRILCYGDSNTWGYIPAIGERYPEDVRWTGRLASMLGSEYRIIEEGLSGRTTVFEAVGDPDMNGETPLCAILKTHKPLDLVIIMLGTNDLQYGHSAWEASRGAKRLVEVTLGQLACFTERKPRVLLISPIHIGENIKRVNITPMAEHGREESEKFALLYRYVAMKCECAFLNGAAITEPSPRDAEHMDEEGHRLFAEAVYKKLMKLEEEN